MYSTCVTSRLVAYFAIILFFASSSFVFSFVVIFFSFFFFFQAEDGIRDHCVTGVQTCCSSDLDSLAAGDVNPMEPLQLSQTVMDQYAVRILMGTFERPASALELSRRFGIPIAACYRRIKELEGLGLVYCERELPSRNGRGLQLFRSRLKSVRIALEDGNLWARVEVGPPGVLAAPQGEIREQTLNLRPVVESA